MSRMASVKQKSAKSTLWNDKSFQVKKLPIWSHKDQNAVSCRVFHRVNQPFRIHKGLVVAVCWLKLQGRPLSQVSTRRNRWVKAESTKHLLLLYRLFLLVNKVAATVLTESYSLNRSLRSQESRFRHKDGSHKLTTYLKLNLRSKTTNLLHKEWS